MTAMTATRLGLSYMYAGKRFSEDVESAVGRDESDVLINILMRWIIL